MWIPADAEQLLADPPDEVDVVPEDDFLLELPHALATIASANSTNATRLNFNRFPLVERSDPAAAGRGNVANPGWGGTDQTWQPGQ